MRNLDTAPDDAGRLGGVGRRGRLRHRDGAGTATRGVSTGRGGRKRDEQGEQRQRAARGQNHSATCAEISCWRGYQRESRQSCWKVSFAVALRDSE